MNHKRFRFSFSKDDDGVSPVVGTILMVAATVAVGGTVFVAVNGFGSESTQETVNAVFKAQAIDTDNDGSTDAIKLTYVSGPSGVDATQVTITHSLPGTPTPTGTKFPAASSWSPGDFIVYADADVPAGTHQFSVRILGTAVLDQSVTVAA